MTLPRRIESAAAGRIVFTANSRGIPATSGQSSTMRRSWIRLSMNSPKKPSRSPRTKNRGRVFALGEVMRVLYKENSGNSDHFDFRIPEFPYPVGFSNSKGTHFAMCWKSLSEPRTANPRSKAMAAMRQSEFPVITPCLRQSLQISAARTKSSVPTGSSGKGSRAFCNRWNCSG